jgi:branched-chain amino acid transport system permease protein
MEYFLHIAILFGIYSILALSLNLVVGYTGLVSVAQAAFFGLGGYTTALLMLKLQLNFFVAMCAGVIVAGLAAILVGLILSRFAGDYYALSTMGFAVITFNIFSNWQSLTRGPQGLPGIPKPSLAGFAVSDNFLYFILTLIFLALIYSLCRFVINSSLGRALQAIREDEAALQVFGYSTASYKLFIFVMSAMIAAVAGGLQASYISYIDPAYYTLFESVFILAIVILGGLASLPGALVGAAFLILLPEILRFAGFPYDVAAQMRQVVYGLLLVILMMYRPTGVLGKFKL